MKKNNRKCILITLVFIGFFGLLFYFGFMGIEKEEIADVEMYSYRIEDLGIGFKYPANARVAREGGMVKITYIGPLSEEMTEITDGYVLYIGPKEMNGRTLKEIAYEEFEKRSEFLEPLSEPQEKVVFGREGYEFIIQGVMEDKEEFFVFQEGELAVIITLFLDDPQNMGYEETVRKIVESIKKER